MEEQLHYKMYALVLYQLSGIQKGIQAQHAISRYQKNYGDNPNCKAWINNDETTIILTPGGSIQMKEALHELAINQMTFQVFHEPDLDNIITSMCFLVDERVWDRKKYPDPEVTFQTFIDMVVKPTEPTEFEKMVGGKHNLFLRSFLPKFKLA